VRVNELDASGNPTNQSTNINSIKDLDGATICVTSGTTTEGNLEDARRENGLQWTVQVFAETAAAFGAYDSGACDAYTSDKSQLASLRTTSRSPQNNKILADTISKEPLGPVVRHGDDQWFDIAKWMVFATFFAEEHGITQANVNGFQSANPEIRRFLSQEGDLCTFLGVDPGCFARVIAAVGNYGEIYERHLGPDGLAITREGSLNDSFKNGGLIYAPPFR